jgi:hypothetical protein
MDRRTSTIEQQKKASDEYEANTATLSRISAADQQNKARQLQAQQQAQAQAQAQVSAHSQEHRSSERASSPVLSADCTYETSTCPSPSKRSSDFGYVREHDQHLKRMRRDSQQMQKQRSTEEAGVPVRSKSSTMLASALDAEPLRYGLGCPVHSQHDAHSRYMSAKRLMAQRVRSMSEPLLPSNHSDSTSRHSRASVEPPVRSSKRSREKVSHHPPISQQTLRELDLYEIFKNAQLRHDIVHDPNLQFRPNTDGERGSKKRHDADRYWRAVTKELDVFDQLPSEKLPRTRVAIMLREIRNILLSLVPQEEKLQVETSFDTDLVIQTLTHGLFDASVFAHNLSHIMKKHCAPMRDEAVDGIVMRIAQAKTSIDFVNALRSTFDVLEVMKLDVANHQLRTLRGYLVDSAVEFERTWFCRKFQHGTLKQDQAARWFAAIHEDHSRDPRLSFADGFVSMTEQATVRADAVPTFTFDHGRLQAIGKDAAEATDLMVVVLLAKQMLKLPEADIPALKQDLWTLMQAERPSSGLSRWQACIPAMAMYLARRADATAVMDLPSVASLTFAQTWLTKHLAVDSPIRSMLAKRLSRLFCQSVAHALTVETRNGLQPACELSLQCWQDCRVEVEGIATRMAAVARFHWHVHGSFYLTLLN